MNAEVLVVDDNATIRTAIVVQFKNMDIVADSASNGREALDKIHEYDYKLILMDIAMPNMDGYEAASAMCSYWKLHGRPAAVIIGVTAAVDMHRCHACGMTDAFVKPLGNRDLAILVKHFLRVETP